MPTNTRPFEASEFMETKEDVLAYLTVLIEEEDPSFFMACVADIAKSKGMTQVAADAGLSRAGLYKALKPDSEPQWSTVVSILRALGLGLSIKPLEPA